ncbi:hypothetical protein G4G28_17905 [Massilia sp. Dwa41.01b]|uniref:hypothetical protein n=1 Tax=unclassified Massilia TaxID=2609279 RepID=UPI001602EDB9|nr:MULTISPECIES: hypothetical protein [unclassified Massilia]QNA89901.1 hypothetical protein G4G28_17905 [Massilia sp. Dwa41.01b]QNB00785.1 hypothetical protein G4G31_21465 [Massilia sp. Se16.2.3]
MAGILGIGRLAGAAALLALAIDATASTAKKCDLKAGINAQQARAGLCKFDPATKRFAGTPAQQAACLTREVKRGASIGGETITPFLKELAGTPAPDIRAVQTLLDAQGTGAGILGGPLGRRIQANYFIIHDTSAPNCSKKKRSAACPTQGEFPPNRDEASWISNKDFLGHPKRAPDRIAHAFTNRVGDSITEVDFADPIATTKFETCVDVPAKAGVFVGVENIQPRIGRPRIPAPGKEPNDLDAPTPGFTPRQYERLALLYVVASARSGVWLIPAFHAVIDQAYADGHDDPQHFDMPAFSTAVQKHLAGLPPGAPAATAATAGRAPAQPR